MRINKERNGGHNTINNLNIVVFKVFRATFMSRSNLSDLNYIYLFGKLKCRATKETFLNDLLNVLLIVLCVLNGSHSLTTWGLQYHPCVSLSAWCLGTVTTLNSGWLMRLSSRCLRHRGGQIAGLKLGNLTVLRCWQQTLTAGQVHEPVCSKTMCWDVRANQ